jgi:alkylated DNA repair dioxygenase AlkB
VSGVTYNSCLLNRYRSGKDSQSYHSDNEKEYGKNPVIASISLGVSRDFQMRKNADHSCKLNFNLAHGDLLVMKGSTQDQWMHAVPKRANIEEERINLTFRNVVLLNEIGGEVKG